MPRKTANPDEAVIESMTYPMNVFDEEAALEDDTDRLIRLALLAEAGLTIEEARAYEQQQRQRVPS